MGLDLTIVAEYSPGCGYGNDVLNFRRDEGLFEKIKETVWRAGSRCREGFYVHRVSGKSESLLNDCYGKSIYSLPAVEILSCLKWRRDKVGNGHIKHYLNSIQGETTIWLYWR